MRKKLNIKRDEKDYADDYEERNISTRIDREKNREHERGGRRLFTRVTEYSTDNPVVHGLYGSMV